MRKGLVALGSLFVLSLATFVAAMAPASLMLKGCSSALKLDCTANQISGSLWHGHVKGLNVDVPNVGVVKDLQWQISLLNWVVGDPWLHVDASAGDSNINGWMGLSADQLVLENIVVEGTVPVNQQTSFVGQISDARFDLASKAVLALNGRLSATTDEIRFGNSSAKVGTLMAQLGSTDGRLTVFSTNEEGEIALDAYCGLSVIDYQCSLSVDGSEATDEFNKRLARFAKSSPQPMFYQYELTGTW